MLPVVRLLDDFNRADAPSLGVNWNASIGWTNRAYRFEVASNTARCRRIQSGQDTTCNTWHTLFPPPYSIRSRVYIGGGIPSWSEFAGLVGHVMYFGQPYATAWGCGILYDLTGHQVQVTYMSLSASGAAFTAPAFLSLVAGWYELQLDMRDDDVAVCSYRAPGGSWAALATQSFASSDMSGHAGIAMLPYNLYTDDIWFDDFRAGAPGGPAAFALGTTAPTVARRIPVAPAAAAFALGTTAPTVARRQFRVWNLKPRSFVWRCHDVEHP